jgi:predicted ATPase
LLTLVGEDAALDESAAQLIAVADEQRLPYWVATGTIFRGYVKAKEGDVGEGLTMMRNGLGALRATGAEAWTTYTFLLLAKAYAIAGQVEEAVSLLADALQIIEGTGGRWIEAELYRDKGELQRRANARAAEELYRKALYVAREQEAKLWELRAATSLARLCRDQGRPAEGRDLLAPVYGWFTEGFGTPDLKEARALLDKLA